MGFPPMPLAGPSLLFLQGSPPGECSLPVQYLMLLRVPLIVGLLLVLLPLIAFHTPGKSLLAGLFEISPGGMIALAATAEATSVAVAAAAGVIYLHAPERMPGLGRLCLPIPYKWLLVVLLTPLPILVKAFFFSRKQDQPPTRLAAGLVLGLLLVFLPCYALHTWPPVDGLLARVRLPAEVMIPGYVLHGRVLSGHVAAAAGFALSLLLYVALGLYGRTRLGKAATVPALCSALTIAMLAAWSLGALTFFVDFYRIPVLAILALLALVTAQSPLADHFYNLDQMRSPDAAPDPRATLTAGGRTRVILAAANGGGIQAAAWSAQVLEGLCQEIGSEFRESLRLISSVSGGSVGSALFVSWLDDSIATKSPAAAAAESSLDEVAWGLAWPDLLKGLCPWVFRFKIGRGRAIEQAWRLNAAAPGANGTPLDHRLSDWNAKAAAGKLPAVVMNATLAESGRRLLLSTSAFGQGAIPASVDAAALHTVDGVERDLTVLAAARLSATFPYVTPASRANVPGPMPHAVDGGYYDNYGMATVVDWLDRALAGPGPQSQIESVLVIQIHGAPVDRGVEVRKQTSRGWFYQAIAPLQTLFAVRGAGQIAHNDVELRLLQQKWSAAGIPIHSVTFEFSGAGAPLSWHLTREQQHAIGDEWNAGGMTPCKESVGQFLSRRATLESCECPICRPDGPPATPLRPPARI